MTTLRLTPQTDAQLDALAEPTLQDIERAKVQYREWANRKPKTRKYAGLLDAKAEDVDE